MKKLVLSVLGAACLCAGPVLAQEAGNVNDINEGQGPVPGTAEWIQRYGPRAVPYPHYPYVAPRALDPRATRREREREREIATLREREIAAQRERDIAAARQRERERELGAARRNRDWDLGRDRDGDGVSNRRDRYPDDPSRR